MAAEVGVLGDDADGEGGGEGGDSGGGRGVAEGERRRVERVAGSLHGAVVGEHEEPGGGDGGEAVEGEIGTAAAEAVEDE